MQTIESICVNTALKIGYSDIRSSKNWDPTSLANGYPALIILFTEINQFLPRVEWGEFRHQALLKLFESMKAKGVANHSLFVGTAGICASLDQASQDDPRYQSLFSKFHHQLLKDIKSTYLVPFQRAKEENRGYPPFLYDVISGLSGMVPYLLRHADEKETRLIIVKTLSTLVELTKPLVFEGIPLPGWFIPSQYANPSEKIHYGYLDTGLAHGIAGVLTALSKASIQNIIVDGQEGAIRSIIKWLQEMQRDIGPFKAVWPSRFGLEPPENECREVVEISYRDGWCYGAPGIVFSYFMAAHALRDPVLYDYAIEEMENVCHRIQNQNTLNCLSFCHGYAGPHAILHQMFLATNHQLFHHTAIEITSRVQKQYDEKHLFGFKSLVPIDTAQEEETDSISLLTGSTGILLSLLFQLSQKPRPWLQIVSLG